METRRSTVFQGPPGKPPSAVWLVDKPAGETSASVVEAFRTQRGGNFSLKVSHGGVLDPFADGLLLVLVGAANRLFERLHEVPKTYHATVRWGVETATGDAGGAVVREGDARALTEAQLEAALAPHVGWTAQTPPATSNVRVDGERAYEKAHRGEAVALAPRQVYCHAARWVRHALAEQQSVLELTVRGGFYVRSLAVDLGRALGVGAHLTALRRTAIGPWTPPAGAARELTGRAVLPWLPSLTLSDAEWGALRGEGAAPRRAATPAEWPLPAGFPGPAASLCRAVHQERLVALVGEGAPLLLPGGV